MREKLAQAHYWVGYASRVKPEDRLTPELAWKRCGPEQREFNLAQVDAILDAMMEPSEEMYNASVKAWCSVPKGTGFSVTSQNHVIWQAMLRAIREAPGHEEPGAQE